MSHWHDQAFFGLHFDLHARGEEAGLGENLTVEHLVEKLRKINPDFVQCDCKGHYGYATYPTKVGVAAPGLAKDMLRIWREAASVLDIPLVVHYSGLWDEACLKKMPTWGRVNSPLPDSGNDPRFVCTLSDYLEEYMIPQLLEILCSYDVDGFWIDGDNWACTPCYCSKCTGLFTERTGYPHAPAGKAEPGWEEWLAFGRSNFENYVRRYTLAIHSKKPGCTVCSNWLYTVRQPEDIRIPVNYLSGDFSSVWSTARANLEARFMSNRGIGWDLLAWGFTYYSHLTDWDFKSLPSLCQEAAVVMSCGGSLLLYDMPDRDGTLTDWHMDVFKEVADFCRERQPYCRDTSSVPQIAILHSSRHFYGRNDPHYMLGNAHHEIEGCLHALTENNYHADIIPETDKWEELARYALVVVPEQDGLSEACIRALKEYVREGGSLIVSGAVHTAPFDELLGVKDQGRLIGEPEKHAAYIPAGEGVFCAMGQWRPVAMCGADEVEPLLFSRNIGERRKPSGYPAAVCSRYGKGRIAGIFGPVFAPYLSSHYPRIRSFIGKVIAALAPSGLIRIGGPARICVSVREREKMIFLHFVNLGCDQPLSPQNFYIENVPEAGPVKVEAMLDEKPVSVTLEPGHRPVAWTYHTNRLTVELPGVGIHDILAVERGMQV